MNKYRTLGVLGAAIPAAFLLTFAQNRMKSKKLPPSVFPKDRAWIEVDLQSLKHNAKILQQAMPKGCAMMAVVKAEAYGHGAVPVSKCLNSVGVKNFAVATIDEGITLRESGVVGEILIMGFSHPSRAKELHKYCLTQAVIDYDHAAGLNQMGYPVQVHIKIDTGMHRLGVDAQNTRQIEDIFKMKHLRVCGIFTHFCVSDSLEGDDIIFTRKQISAFNTLLDKLKRHNLPLPKIHMQSSYGLLNYPDLHCDYARIGIALYGALRTLSGKTNLQPDLLPVLSLKSRIAHISDIKKGESIGYGRAFIADRHMRIAVVAVGYADGIPRSLSCGNGQALVSGKYAPIIGKICMDQLTVDITDIPGVSVGDVAVLIGKDQNAELPAALVAENANTIANDLLSRIGHRLNVIYSSC